MKSDDSSTNPQTGIPDPVWITWDETRQCHRVIDGKVICGAAVGTAVRTVAARRGANPFWWAGVAVCPARREGNCERWVTTAVTEKSLKFCQNVVENGTRSGTLND